MVSRPPEERELVERARRGDAAAFGELVRMHQATAFRVALVMGAEIGDAEEAVQDGFVKAYRALGRFRPGAPFRPWLLAIVANETRNRRRASGRRSSLIDRAAAQPASGDVAPSPEAVALAGERTRTLLAAIDRLDTHDREILVCRYLLDLSEAETAAAFGVRPGTVKSRTSRALARLRRELGEAAV